MPVDLLFSTTRTLPGTKGVNEYVKALYRRLREAIKLACISADQEAAQHKCLYDHRAGVMELWHGDKVLVRLDAYQGAHWKLKNRWGSMLRMVVGRIADDVPAYVTENLRGKQKVLHWVRLLLWSSAEEEEGLQMMATQLAIQVSLITPDCVVVILAMEYGLTRLYKLIIWVISYISSESDGIRSLVPGYLNTSTRYLARMP